MTEVNPDIFKFDPESTNDNGPRQQRARSDRLAKISVFTSIAVVCAAGVLFSQGDSEQHLQQDNTEVPQPDCEFKGSSLVTLDTKQGGGLNNLIFATEGMTPQNTCLEAWIDEVNSDPNNARNFPVGEGKSVETGVEYHVPGSLEPRN